MVLNLKNRYDNKEYSITLNAIDVASVPSIFQVAIVMPSEAAFGEYNYALYANAGDTIPMETGLLKYRPDERETPVEYSGPTTFTAYENEI